jgi:hypothetical protein
VALDKTVLSALMVTKIKAIPGLAFTTPGEAELQKFCDAVSDAVVSHIKAAALVSVTVSTTGGDPQGGTVSSSGSGTGTVA